VTFLALEKFPLLAPGKVDNVAVAKLAQQQSAQRTAVVA